uniref:Uncharacterized protein n=1 Tax=Anguilla anguilla TaxID=7936 RepID=A0A0E9V5U3_ANGAN
MFSNFLSDHHDITLKQNNLLCSYLFIFILNFLGLRNLCILIGCVKELVV